MKPILFSLIMALFTMAGMAQEFQPASEQTDPKTGEQMLVGECPRETLEAFGGNFYDRKVHDDYSPNADTVAMLMELMAGLRVTIVAATWCHDSRLQLPRFLRVLDAMDGFGEYRIICVDRDKKLGGSRPFNIDKVPTFILYFNNKEIGRIVENPQKSIESDIYNILQQR